MVKWDFDVAGYCCALRGPLRLRPLVEVEAPFECKKDRFGANALFADGKRRIFFCDLFGQFNQAYRLSERLELFWFRGDELN